MLAALLGAHALEALDLAPVRLLDAWVHDSRLRLFARDQPDSRVAIVDIDEPSLAAVGRWPWSRARLADLVQRLFDEHQVSLVGLDIMLTESESESEFESDAAPARSEAQAGVRDAPDPDGRLAALLARHPVVLGFHLARGARAPRSGSLGVPLFDTPEALELPAFEGYAGNLAPLAAAATASGFLDSWVDPDGVRRRAPLLAAVKGEIHGSLALALARSWLHARDLVLERAGNHLTGLQLRGPHASLRVPAGRQASVVLPYAAAGGLTPTVSALDILEGRVAAGALRGRIVLLGTTAGGLGDWHPTPISAHLPGIQVHATLLSAMLDGHVPQVPVWAPWLEVGALGAMLALTLPLARMSLMGAGALALGIALALLASNFALWALQHQALPLAGPLLLLAALFAWRLMHGHVWEQRDRRRLETLFGQYVPPELVEHMRRDPQSYDMRGRSAELTVLFADLRGFTRISENLPAADLALLVNEFFSEMTDVIRRHGGTLDKYIGDSVMAFWGAPVSDPLHAQHAVAAAQEMLQRLPQLNVRFAQRSWPTLDLGIGINSGLMVVGDMGSRHRRAYTVLGDAVNVASRLQDLTPRFGLSLLIGEDTQARLDPGSCRLVGTANLRGRQASVTVFTLASA